MTNFRAKPWVNPFGKLSIFRVFEVLVFIAEKCVFSFYNIEKTHLTYLYCLKKKSWKNDQFFEQNHGLTPLEKCEFFDFYQLILFIA